jgi:hypothetical protein
MSDDLIDIKTIAEILGYSHVVTARYLCRNGNLKSARKYGNSWVADKSEVLAYKASHLHETRGRKKKVSD